MKLLESLHDKKIILASASPRRNQLMQGLQIPFEVKVIPNLSEAFPEHLKGAEVAEYLAQSKAVSYKKWLNPDDKTYIITADTIVWFNNQVLNKPENRDDAFHMLSMLSNNVHEVFTGVCIFNSIQNKVFSSRSVVHFAKLDKDEIDFYIDTFNPYDKAGSYGAQEWIGYVAIKHIEGSFFNVMGLPIRQVYSELKKFLEG